MRNYYYLVFIYLRFLGGMRTPRHLAGPAQGRRGSWRLVGRPAGSGRGPWAALHAPGRQAGSAESSRALRTELAPSCGAGCSRQRVRLRGRSNAVCVCVVCVGGWAGRVGGWVPSCAAGPPEQAGPPPTARRSPNVSERGAGRRGRGTQGAGRGGRLAGWEGQIFAVASRLTNSWPAEHAMAYTVRASFACWAGALYVMYCCPARLCLAPPYPAAGTHLPRGHALARAHAQPGARVWSAQQRPHPPARPPARLPLHPHNPNE